VIVAPPVVVTAAVKVGGVTAVTCTVPALSRLPPLVSSMKLVTVTPGSMRNRLGSFTVTRPVPRALVAAAMRVPPLLTEIDPVKPELAAAKVRVPVPSMEIVPIPEIGLDSLNVLLKLKLIAPLLVIPPAAAKVPMVVPPPISSSPAAAIVTVPEPVYEAPS